MIAIDTETTGLDLKHSARPYIVTSCDDEGSQRVWCWEVDPLTRQVSIPNGDLEEVNDLIASRHELVGQNVKFDVGALASVGLGDWPWGRTHDTLIAGHLLASNQPHDLTSMALHYLGADIQPYEDRMEEAVKKCRRMIQQARLQRKRGKGRTGGLFRLGDVSDLSNWFIAEPGADGMPSARGEVWKADAWLPAAMRKYGFGKDHPEWDTVTLDYANTDSAVTLALARALLAEIRRRGLEELYQFRMRSLSLVYRIEARGITYSGGRMKALMAEFMEESDRLGQRCVNIASSRGWDLVMPKSGNNKSLVDFCFAANGLNLGGVDEGQVGFDHGRQRSKAVKVSKKTGKPSLDKSVLEHYLATLPGNSKEYKFVEALRDKRARDTAITYMESYDRFRLPLGLERSLGEDDWYILHPSLNLTGTATLRLSSSNPNEQNISKREGFNLRRGFGPATGREWWSLDCKNVEGRLPAYKSGEAELITLYERPEEPPYYGSGHLLNFHTVYPDLWDKELREVGPDKVGPTCKKKYASTWYQWCKNGGFAIQYGAVDREGGGGTADRAFHKLGAHALLKERFRKLEKLNQACITMANKLGYVETMPDRTVNTKRGYPLMCTRTEWGRVLPTVPLSYYIQGTACWVMARMTLLVHDYLDELNEDCEAGCGHYIIMNVHDEIVLDFPYVPDKGNLANIRHIKALMDSVGDDLVPAIPLPIGAEYHVSNWAESETVF